MSLVLHYWMRDVHHCSGLSSQCSHLILLHINVHISFSYTVQHSASRTMKTCTPHKPQMLELKGFGKWHNRAVDDSSTWAEVQCTDSSSSLSSISASHMSLCQVVIPRYNTSTFGRRAFSVAGPTVWNSLPDKLRDPSLSIDSFRRHVKTFLFADYD